jgi:hypothetical protein
MRALGLQSQALTVFVEFDGRNRGCADAFPASPTTNPVPHQQMLHRVLGPTDNALLAGVHWIGAVGCPTCVPHMYRLSRAACLLPVQTF